MKRLLCRILYGGHDWVRVCPGLWACSDCGKRKSNQLYDELAPMQQASAMQKELNKRNQAVIEFKNQVL